MTLNYPIVEHRAFDAVPQPKRFGGLGKLLPANRTRTPDEVPRRQGNHRLVYRVGGEFVLDNFALALNSPTVLAATDVSVVDVARDTTVVVSFEIPSKDAGVFTVRARFLATVTDEIAVVRAGTADLAEALASYLSGHYPFQEVGQSHTLDEFNDVRLLVNARAKAFTTFMPPTLPGLNLRFASAEVLTPQESVGFFDSVRTETYRTKFAEIQQRNAQREELDRTIFEHTTADLTQTSRNELADKQLRHDLDRYNAMSAEVPADLMSLMLYAAATGQMPYPELIESVRQIQRDTDEYNRVKATREWEAARADNHIDREAAVQVILELIKGRHLSTRSLPGLETAIQRILTGSAEPPVADENGARGLPPDSGESPNKNEIVEVREEDDR
ncbi:hypothetical protein [Nocardia blacklockiae]|uniref:hypothetical protein n=1 Tax=Nocardia blacklockiae TaxID=480036 RepID=UPI0018941FC3|nr:hypothetical protein [Nocardia blacklockiae]MBF6175691.1 hypothetical protein [Nocardia blacklockiae]